MMKRRTVMLLQALDVLIAIAALVFLLWEPHLEGRNAHATTFEIYFKDGFLACAYVASVPFFVALYEAFKLLGYVGEKEVSWARCFRALKTIKLCGVALIASAAAGEACLFIMVRGEDDIAGGVFMGILVTLVAAAITGAAVVLQRRLRARMR